MKSKYIFFKSVIVVTKKDKVMRSGIASEMFGCITNKPNIRFFLRIIRIFVYYEYSEYKVLLRTTQIFGFVTYVTTTDRFVFTTYNTNDRILSTRIIGFITKKVEYVQILVITLFIRPMVLILDGNSEYIALAFL